MLRAIIILLLFHSISIAVFSQNYKQLGESQQSREARVRFKKAVKLNWSLPGISSPVYSTNTSFDLALEIESAYTISDKNITLYVDGKSIDGKAGEASIKKKKSLDKYIFEYSLVQPEDKKVTRIDISLDINGEIHKSTQMEVRHQFDNEKANLHLLSM